MMATDPIPHGDALWRGRDRFPLSPRGGEARLSFAVPSDAGIRPFAMQEVRYARPGESFRRSATVTLCAQRQIGLIRGRPLCEVYLAAPSMTKYDTDGQDILVVDYVEDD